MTAHSTNPQGIGKPQALPSEILRFALLVMLLLPSLGPVSRFAHAASDVTHLDWIEGCWRNASGTTHEVWNRGFEGLYFGRSVTIRDGKLIAFEDMRIQYAQDRLVFFASPNGREPTMFAATESGSASIVFENPAHDFPQRIAYERRQDELIATLSDLDFENSITFAMQACERPQP